MVDVSLSMSNNYLMILSVFAGKQPDFLTGAHLESLAFNAPNVKVILNPGDLTVFSVMFQAKRSFGFTQKLHPAYCYSILLHLTISWLFYFQVWKKLMYTDRHVCGATHLIWLQHTEHV